MTWRVAINGFGRMGRLGLRAGWAHPDYRITRINDIAGDVQTHAHLLEFDSVQGRWDVPVATADGALVVDGRSVAVGSDASPAEGDWSDVDLVVECSGRFKTAAQLAPYFEQGVKKVLVSAPCPDPAVNVVRGVNDDAWDPARDRIITAASCTTNCLAPVIKVLHEQFGIVHGTMTTIHDVTNTQTIIDRAHKDLRRARSSQVSLIPTSTGSARAITRIFPELEGKLNGLAVRVPIQNASLTDLVVELAVDVDAEQVNAAFEAAAIGPLAGVLGYETRPLVSVDYVGDPRSAVVDAPSTLVIDRRQVKVLAWYDNEWGYVCRMMELAGDIATRG